jgi:PAS domain S-box-containing protein
MVEQKKPQSEQEQAEGLLVESGRGQAEEKHLWNRKKAERLTEEMAVIAEIGRVIGSSLDISQVYERFASEVKKLILFDRLVVNVRDPHHDNDTFTIAHVSGLDIPDRMQGDIRSVEGTVSDEVLRKRNSLLIQPENTPEDIAVIVSRFPHIATSFRSGFFSMISVPLVYRDEAIGALHFQSKKTGAYNERDLRLAERIGVQIAGAIANAQLFADLIKLEDNQRRNRENFEQLSKEIAVIAEIGRVVSSTLDINDVYESFALEAKKLVPFDRLSVDLNSADEQTFTVTYVSGFDIPGRRPGDTVPIAGTISGNVLSKRIGLLINTTGVEEITGRFPHLTNTATLRAGMRSLISVPLISRDEVIGTLHFRLKRLNTYTEREFRLAEKIGTQIAGAIANAQLFVGLKHAEGSLRRNEQQLKSYIEGAGDAIYVLKTDTGRILNCNARACLDLGYSRDELVKLSATDIESRLFSGEIVAIHCNLKPGEVKTFEGMHKRKDGSVFPVEIRLSTLSPTQPELMISIVRDITERKQVEEELARYRIHLEEMVKERTAELEIKNITLQELNATLKVLLKQRAEDKKDMEERFVMNIGSMVLPFVEQMKKGRLDVGQQPLLDIIETHLKDIATPLLKNIRHFNLTPKEIKVAALVRLGKTTKEIAAMLSIATGSIDIHRNNIRKKLGLRSRKANLQSHLQTLDQ